MSFRKERFIDEENPIISESDTAGFYRNTVVSFAEINELYLTLAHSLSNKKCVELLGKELERSPLYAKVWRQAYDRFQQKKSSLSSSSSQSVPDECHIAVIAYTLDAVNINGKLQKLYQEFNKECRELTRENWSKFPFKSFYGLLINSIHGVASSPEIKTYQHAYRGINFHYSEDFFKINQRISFNQFTSCSTDPKVAKFFEGGGQGTIIEFTSMPEAAIGITNYSDFDESEILIFPWNKFTVRKIERNGPVHRVVVQGHVSFCHTSGICFKCGGDETTPFGGRRPCKKGF